MGPRRLSRIIALQMLYQWDFYKKNFQEIPKNKFENIVKNYLTNFNPRLKNTDFCKKLIFETLDNLEKIDSYIKKFSPKWSLDQMTYIDRNIIRLGVLELLFLKESPPKAVINEAIEIAKSFAGPNSSKFVNGVLGAIYEEIKKGTINEEQD